MATGIQKNRTLIGIEKEITAGTYVAPTAAASYIQVLSDGYEMTPSKERIERDVLTSSIGNVRSRGGLEAVTGALPVELRASGTEGAKPQYYPLIDSVLGNSRQVISQTASGSGHTTTVINIASANTIFAVGDIVVVLEAGSHSVHAITAVTGSDITILPARTAPPSNGVMISKTSVFYPANTAHASISVSEYDANEILRKAIGAKVTSMTLDNFSTAQIGSLNFSYEGLSFDELNGSAPHTPSFHSVLPPIILNACVYQNGVGIPVTELSLSVENALNFISTTCSGKEKSFITDRTVTGSFVVYKDDTSVDQFTKFNNEQEYSLFFAVYNPSSVSGEIELGSVVGFYMPSCVTTEKGVADAEGILTDTVTFTADRGTDGSKEELYLGFI